MEILLSNLLNALDANVALIDHAGEIVAVNDAWCRFAEENGGELVDLGVGVNYLDVCKNAHGEDGNTFYEGLLSVLNGTQDRFQCRYPCHSPTVQRYFLGTARPIHLPEMSGVLVTHHDVTKMLVEERVDRDRVLLALAMIQSCPQAILAFEPWGKLIEANPSACRVFGYPEGGMSACTYDLLFPEGRSLHELSEALLDDAGIVGIEPFRTTICTVEIDAVPVEANVGLAELGERHIVVFILRELHPGRSKKEKFPNESGQFIRSDERIEPLEDAIIPQDSMNIDQAESLVRNTLEPCAGIRKDGYHILIVDDDKDTLELSRKLLTERGHSTVLANDGVEALELFRRYMDDIDLVLTDYQMPWMNGCEFIQILRKMVRELPVIILTGAHDLLEGDMDSDRYIRVVGKPCRASILLSQIAELMKSASR